MSFSVWVGGGEINPSFLCQEDAERVAEEWRKQGYDDVIVESAG